LNDKRLSTTNDSVFVRNTNTNAIKRTTGFVSSDINGTLIRFTNSANTYLFPVGDSLPVFRYRPVEITPKNTSQQIFAVRFVNYDPDNENFNRTKKDTTMATPELAKL